MLLQGPFARVHQQCARDCLPHEIGVEPREDDGLAVLVRSLGRKELDVLDELRLIHSDHIDLEQDNTTTHEHEQRQHKASEVSGSSSTGFAALSP